jgi:hypothetical protein
VQQLFLAAYLGQGVESYRSGGHQLASTRTSLYIILGREREANQTVCFGLYGLKELDVQPPKNVKLEDDPLSDLLMNTLPEAKSDSLCMNCTKEDGQVLTKHQEAKTCAD